MKKLDWSNILAMISFVTGFVMHYTGSPRVDVALVFLLAVYFKADSIRTIVKENI